MVVKAGPNPGQGPGPDGKVAHSPDEDREEKVVEPVADTNGHDLVHAAVIKIKTTRTESDAALEHRRLLSLSLSLRSAPILPICGAHITAAAHAFTPSI